MTRKTDEERLQELQEKIKQMEIKKQQVEARVKEKERKDRTRRLIQIGAVLESHFGYDPKKNDPLTPEKAEQIGIGLSEYVKKNKEKFSNIDVEKSKEKKEIIYKKAMEKLVIPEENKNNPYRG